jgi:hypothetical protein
MLIIKGKMKIAEVSILYSSLIMSYLHYPLSIIHYQLLNTLRTKQYMSNYDSENYRNTRS